MLNICATWSTQGKVKFNHHCDEINFDSRDKLSSLDLGCAYVGMEDLHDAGEAAKDESHDSENHDTDVLPQHPIPFSKTVRPECNNFNDGRKDER